MAHVELENLLKEAIGLDAASIGSSSIERAVHRRLKACNLEDPNAYWERVRASQPELQELIEAVVIPETWFLRNEEAFEAVAEFACREWLPAHPTGTLRLMSLPCSTGEEPFSMAMTLLDAGIPAERFHIDAVDISTRAIALAEIARYGKNSFRSRDLSFRDRHFIAQGATYQLSERVRMQVRFQHGNMLAPGWLPGIHQYDVIFCRNVLIYFDRPTQERALQVLGRLLKSSGLLFVGPSETGLLLDHEFESIGVALAFAFRKSTGRPRKEKKVRALPPPLPVRIVPARAVPAAAPAPALSPPAAEKVPTKTFSLSEATMLADQGRLDEAERSCEAQMRVHGPSASLFHLLGLIADARGDSSGAIRFYRKALYLDAAHQESLIHLALLLERSGDPQAATLLRTRAQRLSASAKS